MANEADFVVVGHVRRAHGVRGEVLVELLTDVGGRFDPGVELLVQSGSEVRSLRVAAARPHKECVLLRFEGLDDRDQVDSLRGADLLIDSADSPAAPEGAYYYHDLIGRNCLDKTTGRLGEVVAVREDGGGLLLEVRREGEVLLVPFVRSYIVALEEDGDSIELDLPEGLIETCTSQS